MTGGTTNHGGVFGLYVVYTNSSILHNQEFGMHNIIERPIAVNGKVEIHPMMYVALSYDHRIIDGRGRFL
jgi:2-oxoglutarate dehydrogenase E2 component (dihydrolipoamide succinyltransferase)